MPPFQSMQKAGRSVVMGLLSGDFFFLVLLKLPLLLVTDNNGEIDFNEFIEGLSHFSVKSEKDEKLKFAFQIYDIDKDGYISSAELYHVLKQMVGNNLKVIQSGSGSATKYAFCKTAYSFLIFPYLFRCGYRISTRGYVRPSVHWSIGWPVML